MKRIIANTHCGYNDKATISINMKHAVHDKDSDVIKSILEDLKVETGFSLSAKSYRGNYYKLSVVYVGNDEYELTWITKGNLHDTIKVNIFDAVDEIACWNAYTGRLWPSVYILNSNDSKIIQKEEYEDATAY